jgi:hypothetical protein
MKVTYIYPPLFKPFYPIATRVLTESLLQSKNLDVRFSDLPTRMLHSGTHRKLYGDILSRLDGVSDENALRFVKQKYIENNLFYVFMSHGYFQREMAVPVDSLYALVTCINYSDMVIVKDLLADGKKVVMGGPLVNIGLSPRFFRDFLVKMGLERRKVSDRLIVVSGYVDPATDLRAVVRDWKDTTLGEHDSIAVYACERDFLQRQYGDAKGIPVHLGFNNHCWYGKCKFCTYRTLPRMRFSRPGETGLGECIHRIMAGFKATHIRFTDSYYRFDSPAVKSTLEEAARYNITVYTGIKLLKDPKYIEWLNRYVDCLLIGLETTSDFSLKCIRKGYTFRDIQEALDKVVRYLDKRIFLELSVILDLPAESARDVRNNYRNVEHIKGALEEEGFKAAVHMNILNVHPNMELIHPPGGLLRLGEKDKDLPVSSGKNYLLHILRQAGLDRPSLLPGDPLLNDSSKGSTPLGYLSADTPVLRYDAGGKPLPSDLRVMEPDTMKKILLRTSRKS